MASSPEDVATPAKKRPRSKFPQSFWVANTMEIFERLAWYGFFAVSSLYITGSRAEGALGFTSEQRGLLQGIVPFILYLLPVLFGALADRFGYKKTFIVAYSVLVPAYYLLGKFTAFGTFFMAFLFVAVGAAIFKPVITGTVARTTDETNSSMGFGIFYMMVNIGGFIGPIVAGFVRVRYGWDYVFIASAFWIACNFLWLFLFYKEPTTEAGSGKKRTIGQVLGGIVEVLGNGRLFIMVFGLLIMLMLSGRVLSWGTLGVLAGIWVLINFLVDIPLRARQRRGANATGLMAPMKLGNWKFAVYLLILSGFWTSFNQIFLTHPEFIRDFVDTSDMVRSARKWFGDDFARNLAVVNEDMVKAQIGPMISDQASRIDTRIAAIQSGAYLAAFDTIPGNELAVTIPPRNLRVDTAAIKPVMRELWGFNLRVPTDTFATGIGMLPIHTLKLDPAAGASVLQTLQATAPGAARDSILREALYKLSGVTATPATAGEFSVNPADQVIALPVAAKIDSFHQVRPLNAAADDLSAGRCGLRQSRRTRRDDTQLRRDVPPGQSGIHHQHRRRRDRHLPGADLVADRLPRSAHGDGDRHCYRRHRHRHGGLDLHRLVGHAGDHHLRLRRDGGVAQEPGIRRPHRAVQQGGDVYGLLLLVRGAGQYFRRSALRSALRLAGARRRKAGHHVDDLWRPRSAHRRHSRAV